MARSVDLVFLNLSIFRIRGKDYMLQRAQMGSEKNSWHKNCQICSYSFHDKFSLILICNDMYERGVTIKFQFTLNNISSPTLILHCGIENLLTVQE